MPEQLRAIGAGDATALIELEGRVERQGEVFSVTPVVLPFLVELAARPAQASDVRQRLLLLITRLAAARDAEPGLLRQVLTALNAQRDRLGALLDDADPDVAALVAGLAGRFVPPAASWTPALRRLRDGAGGPLRRANFAVAMDLTEGRPPDRRTLQAAAEVDWLVADWRERELSGLMGLRISPGAAARLGALLAWRATAEKK